MKWWLLLLLVVASSAAAHKESDAYLTLATDASAPKVLHGQFDVALRDIAFVMDVDANHDSALTWGEVKASRVLIERYVLGAITVRGDGLACDIDPTSQKIASAISSAININPGRAESVLNVSTTGANSGL